jgi:hypothetical protein
MSVKRLIEFFAQKIETSVTPFFLSLASFRAEPVTGNKSSARASCNTRQLRQKRTVA